MEKMMFRFFLTALLLAGCGSAQEKTRMTRTANKYSLPVNREHVAENWKARGYSCALFVDPPGREWTGFVHATDELVTVVEGRLQITVEGETVTARPGDEIFIPAGAVHTVKNIHDQTTYWLYGYN